MDIFNKNTEVSNRYEGKIPGAGVYYPIDPWETFTTQDLLKPHTYHFPSVTPKSCVIMLHGLSSHSNVSAFLARDYSDASHVFAIDLICHGKSEGSRGKVPPFSILVQDVTDFALLIYKRYKLPLFLHGTSLGAGLAIELATDLCDIVKGIVLFAPALGPLALPRSFLLKCIFQTLICCCPCIGLPKGKKNNACKNQYFEDYVRDDELLVKEKQTFRSIANLVEGMKKAYKKAGLIECSTLIVFGTEDKVTSIVKARAFFELLKVQDKLFYEIEGGQHCFYFDDDIDSVKFLVKNWVRERNPC